MIDFHRPSLVAGIIWLTLEGAALAQSCGDVLENYNASVRQTNARCEDARWRANPGLCLRLYDAQLSRWAVVEQSGCGDRSLYGVIRDRIAESKGEIRMTTDRGYRARMNEAERFNARSNAYATCAASIRTQCGPDVHCFNNSIGQCNSR